MKDISIDLDFNSEYFLFPDLLRDYALREFGRRCFLDDIRAVVDAEVYEK